MSTRAASDLLIHVDPNSRHTLQQQIYEGIRRAILTGLVKPGARLPSSRVLAADLGVCRETSLFAFDQLIAEGYVVTRPGAGTYVAPDLPDDLPRVSDAWRRPTTRHPPLSARATALAGTRPRAWRLPGPPRPFRIGTPAVDLLPVTLWSQLTTRRQRSASPSQFDYGDWPPLREAIAAHLRSARGTQCSAEQVLIVAGAQAGLDLMARLLLDPGDAVWMEEPGYPGAQSALIAAGARLVPVPVDDDGLDVEAGIRRARDARLAYVTPSHQFPLGVVMSLPRRLALLKWASAAEAWVVEDDYDSEFRYGTRPVPCLHGLDVDNRVIYVGTFSKSLFPALRLGFVIVPRDLQERLVGARRALDFQPPVLNQAVLADFMAEDHYERHLRRMRAAYRERLDAMVSAAARYCGGALRVRPVLTGLHAVADLDEVHDGRVAREAIARGVEAMPLSMYASDSSDYNNSREHGGANGLLLGFAPIRPDDAADGMRRLAASIEAARSARRRAEPAAVRLVRA
jgi:GntR family transcriptional regulator/MocR family aminotransferase